MSTDVERGRGLEREGIRTGPREVEPVDGGAVRRSRPPRGRRRSPPKGRSSAAPASTRAARRTTSSSSASRRARRTSPGARSTGRWTPAQFDVLHRDLLASLAGQGALRPGLLRGRRPGLPPAGPRHHRVRLAQPVRAQPVHRRPEPRRPRRARAEFTVIDAPSFKADPARHGTQLATSSSRSTSRKKLVLIGGTSYAGEIKKSVFSVLNYLLPLAGRAARCTARPTSAQTGDVALFFGLSGTGKTTLSSDPERMLIGDDEHGWSDRGVFNFEGGCYAKTIRLSAEAEPQIYATTRRFGTVLENVVLDPATRDARSRRRPLHREHARARIRSRSSTTPCRPARAATRRTSSC